MAETKYTISPPDSTGTAAPQAAQFSIEPPQQATPAFSIEPPAQSSTPQDQQLTVNPPQPPPQVPQVPQAESPEDKLERLAPKANYINYLKKEHPEAYKSSTQPDESIPLFSTIGPTSLPTWNQIKKSILSPGGIFGPPTFDEWRHNELWKSKEGQDLILNQITNQLSQHPIKSALGIVGGVGGAGPIPEEGVLSSKPPVNLETLTQPSSSFGKGLAQGSSSLLSPANIGLMLTMPESKLMGAYYTGQMGKGTLDAAIAARDKYQSGDKEGAYQLLGQAAVSGTMAGVGGYFSVRESPTGITKDDVGYINDILKQHYEKSISLGDHAGVDEAISGLETVQSIAKEASIDQLAVKAGLIYRGEIAPGVADFQDSKTGGTVTLPTKLVPEDDTLLKRAEDHRDNIDMENVSPLLQERAVEVGKRFEAYKEMVEGDPIDAEISKAMDIANKARESGDIDKADKAQSIAASLLQERLEKAPSFSIGENNERPATIQATEGVPQLQGEPPRRSSNAPESEIRTSPQAQESREEDLRDDLANPRGDGHLEATPVSGSLDQGDRGSSAEGYRGGLEQKLTQLVSLIPNFPKAEEVADVNGRISTPTKVESLDSGVGIGSVNSRPPVIDEVSDRELANGGITVIRGGSDIGIIARYLGSLTQAARRLGNPIFTEVAGKMADTSIAISRNTLDAIKGFRKEVRSNINKAEWDKVVDLLNDPAVNKGNLPPNIPKDIRDAYNFTRDLLDDHRVRARDAKREEMVNGGMTRTKAISLIPDDWGIKEGYYVHAFPGNWTINEMTEVDEKGNPIWEPISTGWRQTTLSAAQAKASEYIGNNPNAQLKVELDNISLPGKGITDRNRLQALHEEIKNSSMFIHNGDAPDGVMSDLKNISSRLNFGPRRPAPRSFGPTLQRESNLPGWARDMDNFERYIVGMERYIELAPARADILTMRNQIAQMSGMPDILKPGEIPKRYSGAYANTLGRLDASIEALEGYPTGFDAAVRNQLQQKGYDPNLLNNAYSTMNSMEALLKLGFNPASAGLHLAQTIAATYPVLGEKWTGYGILQAYSSKYDSLVHDLGIEATSNLMDLDTFQAYKGGYLSNISGPVTAAKAGFAALRDTGLFLFSKGVETARRIAAIGGYEKALSEGMNPLAARNSARDALIRTQFLYAPVDSPIALRNIPRPMGQFKNFTFKMMEFTLGLRGAEIPRFLAAMGVIGYSGFPMLNALSNLTKWLTGYDPDNEFKRAFPRFSRGVLGYAGIDYTKNIGFSDWLGSRSMEPSSLLGPGGSDIENIIKAAASYGKGPSREGEQDRDNALRNISPEARRIWDEGMRMATKPSLTDPRTGSTIIKGLTPTERVQSILGLTPLRVAEEKESHEYIRNQIEQAKDKRGYFVDRLAEMEVLLSNPSLTEDDRMQYVKEIIKTAKSANEYGVVANLTKAVRERAKEMVMERLQRDIKKAPKPERFPAYQEMQRFKEESQPPSE
jgi:hypothetical protein